MNYCLVDHSDNPEYQAILDPLGSYFFTMTTPHKGTTGLRRIWNALFYSWAGLRAALQHEAAFRQELLLAGILIPLACFLPISLVSRALLLSSVILVLVIELFNSAIEAVVDRVSLDTHELAKRAKDMGSAAVLLGLINLAIVWLLVLWGEFL